MEIITNYNEVRAALLISRLSAHDYTPQYQKHEIALCRMETASVKNSFVFFLVRPVISPVLARY